jgi:hypothetical protein
VRQASLADCLGQLIDNLLHQRHSRLELDGGDHGALNLHFTGLPGSKVRWILYELALIKRSVCLYHQKRVYMMDQEGSVDD